MKRRFSILCILCSLILLICTACSSPKDSASLIESSSESKNEIAVEESKQDMAMDMAGSSEINMSLDSNLNRKIIKTGSLDIESKAFDETINNIFKKVKDMGGFVESCDISGNSLQSVKKFRYGNLTVRIPEKQFDSFINGASVFGNVIRRGIEAQDITDQYVDTETRLRALEVRRERLMALLEKSGNLDQLFKIEQELADVNYEIETLKGTLNKYDGLVDMATVNMSIEEVELYQEVQSASGFGSDMFNTLKSSLRSLIGVIKAIILVIIAVSPYLIVIGIPILVLVKVILKRLKKDKKSTESDENK